jgi:hypothetical protein
MQIRGIESLTMEQVEAELQAGGRFVFFELCISLLIVTWRWASDIYLLHPRERGLARGLPYTLLTLFLGWWGLPWGLVYTPRALFANLTGGHDVTEEARTLLQLSAPNGGGLTCKDDEASPC